MANEIINQEENAEKNETEQINCNTSNDVVDDGSNDSNVFKWIIRGVVGAAASGGIAYGIASGKAKQAYKYINNRRKEAKIKSIRIKKEKAEARDKIRAIRKERIAMTPEELDKEIAKTKEKESTTN